MKKTVALFLLLLHLPFTIYATPTSPEPVSCSPAKTGSPCQSKANKPSLNLGAGNPIHLVTGNKFQQETDLPMRASGLEFVRYYNSLGANKTLLGEGWSHSYETRLWFAGGKPQIVHADGSRTLFQPRKDDTALAQEASNGKLVYENQNRNWTWQLKPGLEKTFNAKGRLIAVNLPGLDTIRIIRNEAAGPTHGAILEIHGGQQEKLLFHYETINNTARLSRIETPAGQFLYRYTQPQGYQGQRLTGMLRPDHMGKTYFHEPEHQHGNPFLLTGISIHDSSGKNSVRTNAWSYNDKSQAIRSIEGNQNDTKNRLDFDFLATPRTNNAKGLTRITDADGNITNFHTSIKGGNYVLEDVIGHGCHGCAAAGTQARYDEQSNLTFLNGTHIKRDEQSDISQLSIPDSPWTNLQLNYEKGRQTSWFSSITGTKHTSYNDRNQPLEQNFANGDQALFEYDKDGQLLTVKETTKDDKERSATTKIVSGLKNNFFALEFSDDNYTEKKLYFTLQKDTLNIHTKRQIERTSANREGIVNWMPSIEYDDKYTLENEGKTKVHHLPEGGYISYFHNQDNKPETIIWTEQNGKKHHLILDSNIPEKGYVLGNELAFHTLKTTEGQTQLSLWNKNKRFWTQTLDFSQDNTLHRESTIVPDAKYEAGRSYAYDPSKRLISANTSAQHNEQDLSGLHHYAWNKDGSSAAYFDGNDTVKPVIERDASGLPHKAGKLELEYGPNRQLHYISKDKAMLAAYFYDAFGRRTIKTTPDRHVHYYYENNLLAGEWNIDRERLAIDGVHDNISRRYIYAGNLPVAFIEYEQATFPIKKVPTEEVPVNDPRRRPHLSKLYFIHTDHIGQPFMVTDQEQKIHWLAHNSPTGESRILYADLEFNLRLPGQYYDQETGWHYNMHRYYDPAAGHYLEPDPLGALTVNDPFGYAAHQPRMFVDPLGLLLFAFDGTDNNWHSNTNVRKFTELYISETSYTDGTGKIFTTSHGSGLVDAALGYTTNIIIKYQINRMITLIGDSFNEKEAGNPLIPIDIIGYSRGSAIALQFANLLADHTDENGYFSMKHSSNLAGYKSETINACLDLRFIGLFDTVPQFGLNGHENSLHNYSVPSSWQWIAHAVALNEHRYLFPLTPLEGEGNNWIEQGFIGAHSDIGGTEREGDLNDKNNPQPKQSGDLGDIPLAWMRWHAELAGVPLKPTPEKLTTLENPVLYGTPTRNSPEPSKDRFIQKPGSNERNRYQSEHASLGKDARNEVERFITRLPVDDIMFEFLSQTIVGTVDTKSYVAWLEEELNWDSPF